MTAEQLEADRRKLVRAAHRLEKNEDFVLLRKKLFAMAPPLERTAFQNGDSYNAHAAAFRDGASTLTRWLLNLSLSQPEKDEERKPNTTQAEFTGA